MIKFQITSLLITVAFCIFLFADAYATFIKIPYGDAFFSSLRIQTLSGSNVKPLTNEHKILIGLQHTIAYLISSGLIIMTLDF